VSALLQPRRGALLELAAGERSRGVAAAAKAPAAILNRPRRCIPQVQNMSISRLLNDADDRGHCVTNADITFPDDACAVSDERAARNS